MLDDDVAAQPLSDGDVAELVRLAEQVVAADGGMPLASDPAFLSSRWRAAGSTVRLARDDEGVLVGAAVVRPSGEGSRLGLLGGRVEQLLDWGLAETARRGGTVTVEVESLTPALAESLAARGLRQVFAEDVLRRDLAAPPPTPAWTDGATLHPWTAETAPRFFAAYETAFRDRPGFLSPAAEEWIDDLTGDDEFRPAWSVLVELPGLDAAGFVTALATGPTLGWIDQVGVVPAARGRGLGAALTAEALRRMRADGATGAWLTVNVDNPVATNVYLGLGFRESGRRARFEL